MAELALDQEGYQQLTVSTAAVGLTLPTVTITTPAGGTRPKTPRHAMMRCVGQNVRWRADGTNPTSTVGYPLNAGETLDFTEPFTDHLSMIQRIRFIRDSAAASDATLEVAFFV